MHTSKSIFFKVVKRTWSMRNMLNRKKNQVSELSVFYFSSYGDFWSFLYSNHSSFWWIFHDNSKNKNWKIVYSFVSAHCASTIKIGSKLKGSRGRGWGGFCISFLGTERELVSLGRESYAGFWLGWEMGTMSPGQIPVCSFLKRDMINSDK